MTGTGIYGTIHDLDDDHAYLEVAPGVVIKLARRAVAAKVDRPGATRRGRHTTATPTGPRAERWHPAQRRRPWSLIIIVRGRAAVASATRSSPTTDPFLGLDLQGGVSVVLQPAKKNVSTRHAQRSHQHHQQAHQLVRAWRGPGVAPGQQHPGRDPRREGQGPGPRPGRPDRRAAVPARAGGPIPAGRRHDQTADPTTTAAGATTTTASGRHGTTATARQHHRGHDDHDGRRRPRPARRPSAWAHRPPGRRHAEPPAATLDQPRRPATTTTAGGHAPRPRARPRRRPRAPRPRPRPRR